MARGQLRVYLGAAPGVGKTYEMLEEGQRRAAQGADCVVALFEPHGRRATIKMAEGLEILPRRQVSYRGVALSEMDLDGVLARHPQVALVDELAHTNAPGSRHSKRWRDVDELLDAGIDVVTTVNVQHLESLNDVVAELTGVRQRETLPDAVVRRADELDLVDISPEALRRRMVAGDIYPPDRIDAALSHYFRPSSLIGLRELALLWLADQVDEGLQRYHEQHGLAAPWEARERVVVGVSGGPESGALIRRSARLVEETPGSVLMAVHVARSDGRTGADAVALAHCRELVESLGGSWHQVVGTDVAEALVRFALHEHATQLAVGVSQRGELWAMLGGHGAVARKVMQSGESLDVHVVADESKVRRIQLRLPQLGGVSHRRRLAATVTLLIALPALTVALARVRADVALSSDLLIYLLCVVAIAVIGGVYPALLAALVSSVLAAFYFIKPTGSLEVVGVDKVLTLAVYVATAVLVSLTVEVAARRQRLATRASAEAAGMMTMAGALLRGRDDLPRLLEEVRETFGLEAVSLMERPGEPSNLDGPWYVVASSGDRPPERPEDATAVASLSPSMILAGRDRVLPPTDLQIFAACAAQVAETVRHRRLAEQAASAEQRADTERQRSALVAAAGRVLSEPVSSARRALTALRTLESSATTAETKPLLDTVEQSIDRISVLVQELADLARARARALNVHLRPVDIAEVVTAALDHLGPGRHDLDVRVPDDLPDVIADAAVLTRVVTSLAANALRRRQRGATPILRAVPRGDRVEIRFEYGPSVEDAAPDVFRSSRPAPDHFGGQAPSDASFSIAVARDLVEAINGSLRMEEGIGGTTFVSVSLVSAAPHGS